MIKYLGSKRLLIPTILGKIQAKQGVDHVLDLFSGTSRVGHALKSAGYQVTANDHNAYAETIARCYIQTDKEAVWEEAKHILEHLSNLQGRPGYFTETFCVKSRFFQPFNGERIDAIRSAIAEMTLSPELESVLLVSLMEAADRVDSTTGVQMAYLKQWAQRSYNPLELRMPDLVPRTLKGRGRALSLDAEEAAKTSCDLAYLDPPYNQHKYLGNYHVWETLVRWDAPEVYGVACKRVDCRERGSEFNSKPKFEAAFTRLVSNVVAKRMLVSFNDEGFLNRDDLVRVLSTRGEVTVTEIDYKRYVGAQIGIHNPEGQKVGTVSHTRNTEYLFDVDGR